MTARFGICERVLIRFSVMPSLRYSVLGSEPTLTNGSTAREAIVEPALDDSQRLTTYPRAVTANSTATVTVIKAFLCRANNPTATCVSELEVSVVIETVLTDAFVEDALMLPSQEVPAPGNTAQRPELVSRFSR